jgi:hypothetical protein
VFVGLMNALCCKQTLSWPKKWTNYFDHNWLCTINIALRLDWPFLFTHLSRGGKSLIISPSHLKIQKVVSKTWMQIEAHNQKKYLQINHDTKKYDQRITWLFLRQLLFWYMEWNESFSSNSSLPPRWSHKN